jgi:hypothetical protein
VADDHIVGDTPPWAEAVSGERGRERYVEDDRDGRQSGGGRSPRECPARVALEVRRVDDAEQPGGGALGERSMQERERASGRGLVRLVARNQPTEGIGREDLVAREVTAGERRLAGAGRPDEEDDGRLRERDDEGRLGVDYVARRASQPPASAARIS